MRTLQCRNNGILYQMIKYRIRRLTPRECFRLMDFPDTFTWPVSDSQAYKQAGNSIVVNVLYKILKNLLK
jgi:DNA (cytosine-5)-methyltransferase 1